MTRFIALVSGKGGVGKTTAAINIAQALLHLKQKVLLLDANLSTPNIGLHLGVINPQATVNHFLRRQKTISEITHTHASGLSFVPASPSYKEFQKSSPEKLVEIFEHLDNMADFVIVDAPGGHGEEVNHILKNCDEALIVVNPTLSSAMEALKVIEAAKQHNSIIAGVVLNMSNGGRHELKPSEVTELLGYPLIANIRTHRKFRKALHRQTPLTYEFPYSRLSRQFKNIAEHLNLQK
jgi:septum site-determining protein MinD